MEGISEPKVHTRLAIIGLSQCPELLRELRGSGIELRGVADFDLGHEAIKEARAKGIYVTQDYTELLERPDVDLVLNLIPDKTVEAIIRQLKPDGMHAVNAAPVSLLSSFCSQWIRKRFLIELLEKIGVVLGGVTDLGGFVARVLGGLESVLDLHGIGVWIMKKDGFRFYKGTGFGIRFRTYNPSKGQTGPFSKVLDERGPVWSEGFEWDRWDGNESLEGSRPGRALLLPMVKDFDVKGVMALFCGNQAYLDKEDLQLVKAIVGLLCQVMEKNGAFGPIRDRTIRDELTGLYNEIYFLDRLSAEIKRAARNGSEVALLYIVLDEEREFKDLDREKMELFLRFVASELLKSVRNVDVAARYRLADFVLILPDTGHHGALSTASRLLERISFSAGKDVASGSVSMSIGIAYYPAHASQAQELLEKAELSARLASREGENQIRTFPGGPLDLDGLGPDAIVRKYPNLADLFEALTMQSKSDPFMFIHAREVARNALRLAEEAGLSPQKRLEIAIAGWLHDVGKLALPDANGRIRLKFPKLRELDLKLHPRVGALILRNLGASATILKGVFYHHARFDGLGQPPRLRGEGIPIEGRIVGVANAFQHLLGERGDLKEGKARVFQKLREKGGGELDPRLVECMIRAASVG